MPTTNVTRRGAAYTSLSTPAPQAETLGTRARQLFDEPLTRWMRGTLTPASAEMVGWYPAAEVGENDTEFTVSVELAGMKGKDVSVDFSDDVLTIRGEKKTEREEKDEERKFHVWERSYGSFLRSFEFPNTVDVDKVKAEFNDGVLKVHLPKRPDTTPRGRKIPVSSKG